MAMIWCGNIEMARIVTLEEAQDLWGQLQYWCYNAADSTGTHEIAENLRPLLNEHTARTYAFERALQAPAFAMTGRGIRTNATKKAQAVSRLQREIKLKLEEVDTLPMVRDKWDGTEKVTGQCPKATRKDGRHKWEKWEKGADEAKRTCVDCGGPRMTRSPFNPNSPQQCKRLFYELLGVKPMKNKKGEVSVDEDVLIRIEYKHQELHPLPAVMVETRKLKKQLGFLKAKCPENGRYYYTINIGGPWTGRAASRRDHFGYGGNVQNIAPRLRYIFEADPGYELFYADLERAESMTVAYESGDERYIEAHEGDTHTYVARLVFPDLPWTGDLVKDKKVAAELPPWDQAEGHSYRFQSKRIQHGSNFGLTPYGMARIAHLPVAPMEAAQDTYFNQFPRILSDYQEPIRRTVIDQKPLFNALGRRIVLLGRPWDKHTWRQGYAFKAQSLVADDLNVAMWHIWNECDPGLVVLLAQVHDAILGQWPIGTAAEAAPEIARRMRVPIPMPEGRTMTIPVEIMAGKNWGYASKDNPDGMRVIEV